MVYSFQEGRTALHYASLNGYAEVAQLLAIEGCDIDAQDNVSLLKVLIKCTRAK